MIEFLVLQRFKFSFAWTLWVAVGDYAKPITWDKKLWWDKLLGGGKEYLVT